MHNYSFGCYLNFALVLCSVQPTSDCGEEKEEGTGEAGRGKVSRREVYEREFPLGAGEGRRWWPKEEPFQLFAGDYWGQLPGASFY